MRKILRDTFPPPEIWHEIDWSPEAKTRRWNRFRVFVGVTVASSILACGVGMHGVARGLQFLEGNIRASEPENFKTVREAETCNIDKAVITSQPSGQRKLRVLFAQRPYDSDQPIPDVNFLGVTFSTDYLSSEPTAALRQPPSPLKPAGVSERAAEFSLPQLQPGIHMIDVGWLLKTELTVKINEQDVFDTQQAPFIPCGFVEVGAEANRYTVRGATPPTK